ncbi:MAG: hypothetical protein CEE38_15990 [Planctomycetes bacterium B3_Pla]|nr:MAG: hypothetical protein CEE38_15990 [Planctomycetes bacterium B3_Pla]
MKRINSSLSAITAGFLLMLCCDTSAPAADNAVEQWTRFEDSLTSTKDYGNPVQDVKVKVEFTSPNGDKRTVLAFWDEGMRWRVRFSPDRLGGWTYKTSCSDKANKGLHNQTGLFQCRKYQGDLSLFRHGELRLSDSRRYIEHTDGTPFFFLSDTVWCGPLLSDIDDWNVFLKDRVAKEFTAIQFVMTQWRMAKTDAEGNLTFTGKERVAVNPAFFQRLDRYVDAINNSGLVAVPVLLWAIRGNDNPGYFLPEDQKIALAEYMIARYGAHQVIWFLGGDGKYSGEGGNTWHRVGRAVFHKDQHRLATMHPGGKSWVGREFRNEPWFSFVGYQSGHGDDEKTFRWLNQGPPATEWNNKPNLPVINIEPNYEAHNGYTHRKVHNDHSVRRAAYWSLLVSPPAGVTYGGQGIWGWHTKVQAPADHISTGLGSPWHVAKDLPGAFSMKYLHQFFKSIEWWELVPAPELLAQQPGRKDASKFIAAARSKAGDLAVAYLPEGGSVTLKTESLRKGLAARWYHPRTGGWLDAGKIEKSPQTFKTADRNDWILLVKEK